MNGTPLHPPVAGLPERFWKTARCSSCHKWSTERLCNQAQNYLGDGGEHLLAKKHPYGGAFKRHLGHWAAGGCR